MTFTAIVEKEVHDLIREKRFGGWALTFLAFWTFVLFMYLQFGIADAAFDRNYPEGVIELAFPAFFVFSIAFVVLALFMLSDGIAKERESGMLPLVGVTPAVRWHVPLAKLIAGMAAYVGAYLVSLLPMLVFAYTAGFTAIVLLTKLFLGPLLVLYLFLLGLGLLVGTAFTSSKVAIGVGSAVYLPLFLAMSWGPFQMLYGTYPTIERIISLMPFEAAYRATITLAYGGVMPWNGIWLTLGLAGVMIAAAFWVFHRQEVAA